MIAPTGRPSGADFERWGFVTDPYHRGRPGRTHTLNDCPVGGDSSSPTFSMSKILKQLKGSGAPPTLSLMRTISETLRLRRCSAARELGGITAGSRNGGRGGGGRLIGWYWTFGHHDWMAIGEFPMRRLRPLRYWRLLRQSVGHGDDRRHGSKRCSRHLRICRKAAKDFRSAGR